jgi:L-threonylcarbamoyladenylate synthase
MDRATAGKGPALPEPVVFGRVPEHCDTRRRPSENGACRTCDHALVTNPFRRRQTRVLASDAAGIAEAASMLRAGGLVAFPTETVYGLGANALDAQAVRGIFAAKGRPADDPLIVHLAGAAQLDRVAVANALSDRLGDRFWPGPLTLVLPKQPRVPPDVTAGLDTVGVRVPAHAMARALLEAAHVPLAAPSANLFGRPSPTRAEHVLADLDGRIDAVLDGGPTTVGVESTIVDVSCSPPRLLRPGGLAAEDIEALLGLSLLTPPAAADGPKSAPGLMLVHYSPRTPLTLIVGEPGLARRRLLSEVERAVAAGQRVGVLALADDQALFEPPIRIEVVGAWADPVASATRLFDALRALDASGLDVLVARELADPLAGMGRALSDRLHRAARRVI